MLVDKTPLAGANELKQTAVRGVFWTGSGTVGRQLVQVTTSLILARLLTPDVFGLLGMAMVFIEIAQLFVDFGLGLAVLQTRQASEILLSSCFWLSSGAAVVAALLVFGAAPAIAEVYGEPRITMLMPFLSLNLVLAGVSAIPSSLLQREMRFAALAKITFASAIVSSAIAVALAATGFGVWSLVIQPLVGTSMMCICLFAASKWLPRWEFSWASLRGVIRFSSGILGTTLLNYSMRNSDNFLVGRFIGADALGYYTMAYRLMLFPLGQVSNAIGKVAFPILVQLQNDGDRYRKFYLRSCSAVAFVTFPMMCGLFVVADTFVAVVLGDKWLPATTVLKILCPVGLLQSIGTSVGNIFNSTGRTRTQFWWSLAAAPVTIAAFAVGLFWGIEGVASCYAAVSTVLTLFSFRIAFKIVGLTLQSLAGALWRPLACGLLMAIGLFALDRIVLAANFTGLLRLGADVSSGAAMYLSLSIMINRQELKILFEQARAILRPATATF